MSDRLSDSLRNIKSFENMSAAESPLHSMSAAIKILMTLVYVVTIVSFGRYDILGLMPFVAYPAIALALMPIPTISLLKKTLLALPFVLFVGIGNMFFDTSLAMGLLSFCVLVTKTFLCVAAVLILAASTPINSIVKALRQFRVPCVIVLQLMLTFRYIEILILEAVNLKNAYLLRAPNRKFIPIKDWARLVGNLLLRSLERADNIYKAMVCRGFDAHKISLAKTRSATFKECMILVLFCAACVALRSFDFSKKLGEFFLQ